MNLAQRKLKESGLSIKDARALGISELSAKQTAKKAEHYSEIPSLFIPYFSTSGAEVPDMHRVRYLGATGGFDKDRKYDQPEGMPPYAYFPKPLPWSKIIENPEVPVYITEGELKACAAWKYGIACIGLGGVWSWRSKKLGLSMLPSLGEIEWSGRPVFIVFDSDSAFNPNIRVAIQHLGSELAEYGAEVMQIRIPQGDEKVGLDDFLVAHGKQAFFDLERMPVYEDQAIRDELFSSWVYVAHHDDVVDLRSEPFQTYRSRQHFLNATGPDRILNGSGKLAPAAVVWYADPTRITVPTYVMEPTDERIVIPGVGLNRYEGLGVKPVRGNVAPVLKLIDAVCGKRPWLRKWLFQWMAYPLQNPGAKLLTCVLLFHHLQGVGKTFLGYILADIYGRTHGVSLSEEDFFGEWSDWVLLGLFCLCDDLSFGGDRKSRHRLKNRISEEVSQLRVKNKPAQMVANHSNFFFTSNSAGALPLEQGANRRVCVIEMQKILPKEWFAEVLDPWRRKQNGPAHFLYYLLHNVDCSDFDPQGWAPDTPEKELAVEASGGAAELWMRDALDRHFALSPLWTLKQIQTIYEEDTKDTRTKGGGIARALGAVGARRYPKRLKIDGAMETIYCFPPDAIRLASLRPEQLRKKYKESFE